MIARVHDDLGLWPRKLIGDTGYGSADMLAWLVNERDIEPNIPVFDHSSQSDGIFERAAFVFDHDRDQYDCPGGKPLRRARRSAAVKRDSPSADGFYRYAASKRNSDEYALQPRWRPGT